MRIRLQHVVTVCLLGLASCTSTSKPQSTKATLTPATWPTSQPVNRWEKEVSAYETADKKKMPAPGGIVFYGSSTVARWKTLADDFAGLPVLNRGFGGSQSIDAVRYADRLCLKYRPKVIVYYEGDNDLADRFAVTPQQVARNFETFCDLVHRELPETKIFFLAIKPSPSRLKLLNPQREANQLVIDFIATDPIRLRYIDVFTPTLDANGQPKPELFESDRLHVKRETYRQWATFIRPMLEADYPTTQP
ncbi:MAG: GDSL-type esterase/lipase family protein [Tepidisphaeraceae bacterium]